MGVFESRRVRWSLIISGAFIVSVTILAQLPIAGVRPEVMLLIAVCAGLAGGPERGVWVGFISGLLVDLTLHGTLGVTALCMTIVGFFVGMVAEVLPDQAPIISVVIAAVASAAGVVLYATVAQFLGGHTLSDPDFGLVVAIVTIWNAVLCLPVLSLCRRAEGSRSVAR